MERRRAVALRMRTFRLFPVSALALIVNALGAQPARPGATPSFTIEDLIKIKHPSGHQWTPDGKHVWWTYNDGGVNNVWAAPTKKSKPPDTKTSKADGQSGNGGFWSADGQTFFFQRAGGLVATSVKDGAPHTAWATAARGRGFTLSPDGSRVALVVGGGRGAAPGAAQ